MLKKIYFASLLGVLAVTPVMAASQGDIKVVPIGETIRPEASTPSTSSKSPARSTSRRRPRPAVVKEGQTFLVELGTSVSTSFTKEGDSILLRAVEDVGPSKQPGISNGAEGEATVSLVNTDKKNPKIVLTLDSIRTVNDTDASLAGEIVIEGQGSQAYAAVGERYTATLGEKLTVKPRRLQSSSKTKKAKGAPVEPTVETAFAEINGKGVKADLEKGKAKGMVQLILEAPKGYTSDDIDTATVRLAKVNNWDIPDGVLADAKKPRQSDGNKNSVTDWTMYFNVWEFLKYQPRGTNNITIGGNLNNGKPFEAVTRVQVDY